MSSPMGHEEQSVPTHTLRSNGSLIGSQTISELGNGHFPNRGLAPEQGILTWRAH